MNAAAVHTSVHMAARPARHAAPLRATPPPRQPMTTPRRACVTKARPAPSPPRGRGRGSWRRPQPLSLSAGI